MAAVIDGVTHSGYWKLTIDDSTPSQYYVVPKNAIFLDNSGNKILLLTDPSAANFSIATGGTIKDHDGNTLTNDQLSEYIEIYR